MHNYSVANRYKTKTKLGNWYEQSQLNDYQFKQYLYKKEKGENLTLNTNTKLSYSQQPIQVSVNKNNKIYYGDKFLFGNSKTQSYLAYNINQCILGQETYTVTTSKNSKPVLRNIFQFEPASQLSVGPTVKYGDKIRVVTYAANKKLYLQSLAVSPMRSSKFSRHQQVSVTADLNSNTLWCIDHVDPKLRFDAVGQQVQTNGQILLRHIPTNQWLASDLVNYINDFGQQYQVFGKSYLVNNKTQNLYSQLIGNKSAENPLRGQGIQNSWRIIQRKQ